MPVARPQTMRAEPQICSMWSTTIAGGAVVVGATYSCRSPSSTATGAALPPRRSLWNSMTGRQYQPSTMSPASRMTDSTVGPGAGRAVSRARCASSISRTHRRPRLAPLSGGGAAVATASLARARHPRAATPACVHPRTMSAPPDPSTPLKRKGESPMPQIILKSRILGVMPAGVVRTSPTAVVRHGRADAPRPSRSGPTSAEILATDWVRDRRSCNADTAPAGQV